MAGTNPTRCRGSIGAYSTHGTSCSDVWGGREGFPHFHRPPQRCVVTTWHTGGMTTVTYRRLKQQLNAATLGETWSRWHDARIYTPATVGGAASWQELLREGSLIPVTDRHAIPSIMTESAGTRMRIAHLEHRIAATEVVSHTTALWVHCGGPLPAMRTSPTADTSPHPPSVPDLSSIKPPCSPQTSPRARVTNSQRWPAP